MCVYVMMMIMLIEESLSEGMEEVGGYGWVWVWVA